MSILKSFKKSSIAWVLLPLTLLLFEPGGYWQAHCFGKWAGLMALGLLCVAVILAYMTSWFFFPFLCTAFLSAVWIGIWTENLYTPADISFRIGVGHDALYGILCIIVAFLCIGHFKGRASRLPFHVIFWGSVLRTFYQWELPPYERGAFSGNASMNGCLIAALAPLVVVSLSGWRRYGVAFCAILAIYMTGASVPLGVLALVTAGYLVGGSEYFSRFIFWGALSVAAILGMGYLLQGPELFNPSGRFEVWKYVYAWWAYNTNHFFGAGIGSTMHVVSSIQLFDPRLHDKSPIYMWLHNDWYQTLFEMGYVGLISLALAYVYLLKKSFGRPALFASLLGYGAMGVFNYPLRLPLHAFCLTLLVAVILGKEER